MAVYEDMLEPGGAMLRTQTVRESLIGATYQQARRSFDKVGNRVIN
jgi:hypothetical protein